MKVVESIISWQVSIYLCEKEDTLPFLTAPPIGDTAGHWDLAMSSLRCQQSVSCRR